MARTCKADGCRRAPKSDTAWYCDDPKCIRKRTRERNRKYRAPKDETNVEPEAPSRRAGGVFAATLTVLTEAGRVNTPAGQNVLALATRIDHGAEDSGSSIAALSRQHLAALAEALRDADQAADIGDELQDRRRRRAAGA